MPGEGKKNYTRPFQLKVPSEKLPWAKFSDVAPLI